MSKSRHELILISAALIVFGVMVAFASMNSPDRYASAYPSENSTFPFPSTVISTQAGEVFNDYDIDAVYPSKDYSLVNINTADIDSLCTLEGIGKAKAQAIIEYRKENGYFTNAYDLTAISGISKNTVEANIDKIIV